jgi:hypothetical protein
MAVSGWGEICLAAAAGLWQPAGRAFMKHVPFDSALRPNFAVVEQRQGAVSYFPHPDQLPILHRALNLDFRGGLPSGIAKVNARSDGFRKVLLRHAGQYFAYLVHGGRKDGLTLFQLHDRDLLARIAVVQQVTEHARLGACHRFRFYAGADFAPEIYLSGKEIIFAQHALERYNERVPHIPGEALSSFLLHFLSGQFVAAPVNGGRAFLMPADNEGGFLAFPFKESGSEYFITTCLTMKEIHDLVLELPTQGFNFHYDRPFVAPKVRHWNVVKRASDFCAAWDRKHVVRFRVRPLSDKNWYRVASFLKGMALKQGHGPGSQLVFLDDVPGPSVAEYKPGVAPGRWDELAEYQQVAPKYDWPKILAERDEKARQQVPVFAGVGQGAREMSCDQGKTEREQSKRDHENAYKDTEHGKWDSEECKMNYENGKRDIENE